MPLPVSVTIENANATVASNGSTPIDGAVQWQDPPVDDWGIYQAPSGDAVSVGIASDAVLDLGAKGTFACTLGSMASRTTRRFHCPGVPLDAGERVTGSIVDGSVATTKFAAVGDGLALMGGDAPSLEFGSTALIHQRTVARDFNPLREVQELEGRNATYGVFYQWRLRFWPGTKRVGFTVTMSFTDERLTDRTIAWPRVRIRVPRAWQLSVENSSRCPGNGVYLEGLYRYWDVVAAHTIHDGQSPRFRGTFQLPGASAADVAEWNVMPGYRVDVPRHICDPDEFRGKLTPLYEGLPARPRSVDTASCRDRYDEFVAQLKDRSAGVNDYTRAFFDNENKNRAREAASQPDFAAGPFYEAFFRAGGNPLRLVENDCAGERHMARPITQRRRGLDEVNALNARPVKWGDYPPKEFVLQGSYTFVRIMPQDPDIRGKSITGNNARLNFFQGMTGLWRSHHSIFHAIESLFLTGCFDAEDIVQQHIDLWLYEWIADETVYHTRATQTRFARSIDSMAWCYFITGDTRILSRLNDLERVQGTVFERYVEHRDANHVWRTFGINSTNETVDVGDGVQRTLRGTTADPWQIALCQGYYRAWQLTQKDFWLNLTKDLTRTWVFSCRYGRRWVLGRSPSGYVQLGPQWHSMFKVIYPGLNGNPGTYGEFPPAEWYTEENDRVMWRGYADMLWTAHMLAITYRIHAGDPSTQNQALTILAQEYLPWRDSPTPIAIDHPKGEWFGDDALIPGHYVDPNDPITIIVEPEAVVVSEPGFSLEGLVFAVDAERATVSEPAATFQFGPLELNAAAEAVAAREPGFLLVTDTTAVDIAAPAERVTVVEPSFDLVLALELGPYAAEAVDVTESGATLLAAEDYSASPERVTVSEPGFVLNMTPTTGSRTSTEITARSGNAALTASSGNAKIRAEAST